VFPNIGDISQAASGTGTIATRVSGASGKIGGEADTLRREVESFLASIKAA